MWNPDNLSSAPRPQFPHRLLASFLRLFFNLLYHQLAWLYDWVAWMVSLGAWQKWVLSLQPYLIGPRTLEIGFGPGHLQAALNQNGVTPFGLDESVQMGRITRRRLIMQGFRPNLVRGDALALPFANDSFQQVALTFPSEYILNSLSLAEIQRVLVNGGMAVMLPLAWITGRRPLERTAAWLNRVTGEAPEWNERSLEPFLQAGFGVSWEMVELDSSKVLVIKMVKTCD